MKKLIVTLILLLATVVVVGQNYREGDFSKKDIYAKTITIGTNAANVFTISGSAITGSLAMSANLAIGGTLTVTGTSTFTGAGAFASTLEVTGVGTINSIVLTGGTNTFSLVNGTAGLDVAAAATVNVDNSLTVNGGFGTTLTSEDVAGVITLDEQTFEVEGEGTATRLFKLINSEDAARTLTFAEDFSIGNGAAVTITAEDVAGSIVLDEQTFEVEGEGTATQLLKLINNDNAPTTLTLSGTSLVATGGTNTLNLTAGTSSLDIATAKTVNFDMDFAVGGTGTTITGVTQANTLTLNEGFTIGDGSAGTLTFSAGSKVLTISDNATINQSVTTTSDVVFDSISAGNTELGGSLGLQIVSVSAASYDVLATDHILNVTYTATGAVAIDLKTAQLHAGRVLVVKDAGGNAAINNITITTEASETIDGDATLVINGNYNAVNLYCDGTNWFIY